MNMRQRYREVLTFGQPDKVPLSPGGPRESTLTAWHGEGLPEETPYLDVLSDTLGIDPAAFLKRESVQVSFKMIPEFEVQILRHVKGHYVIRDWMGAVTEISDRFDESYLRSAKDFVTRKWHRFPVETREDWEAMKTRYNPYSPGRIPTDFDAVCRCGETGESIRTLSFNGVFWQLREWCGFENLCILMAEDPEFVREMAQFWSDFVMTMLEQILPRCTPDCVFISEDMAYKAHSMISPDMTRDFIQPAYFRWLPAIRKSGCPVVELDSDGCVDELIPLWIESGIHCCSPVEVAAHCDILEYRRRYGKSMAFMQGIDKRVMAVGGKTLRDHVMAIVPVLYRDGGYIPGCDHGVPPDISWKNYVEFTRLLAMLSGWL